MTFCKMSYFNSTRFINDFYAIQGVVGLTHITQEGIIKVKGMSEYP